jgi:hypothetical protein
VTILNIAMVSNTLVLAGLPSVRSTQVVPLALGVAGFLCLLNVVLAIIFRNNKRGEVVSYYAALVLELLLFVAALLVLLGVISGSLFRLPQGLPFNQAEIGVALAIGIGLFPAAYWHRINVSDLPKRIAEDGKNMNDKVRVRNSLPGEWMN